MLGALFDSWCKLSQAADYTLGKRSHAYEVVDSAYLQSLSLLADVAERMKDTQRACTLCGSYAALALYTQDRELEKACCRQIIRLDSTLGGNRFLKSRLSEGLTDPYAKLQLACSIDKDKAGEKQVLLQYVQVLGQLRQEKDSAKLKKIHCDALGKLVALLANEGDYVSGTVYAQQMLEAAHGQEQVSLAHNWLGTCYKKQGDHENARFHYMFMLQQCRAAFDEAEPCGYDCYDLITACLRLGEVSRSPEKEQLLQEAKTLMERYADVVKQWNEMLFGILRKSVENAIDPPEEK